MNISASIKQKIYMLLSYSHLFHKNLGSRHKVCSNTRIHTGFCVWGEVWEVVVEVDV